MESGHGVVGSRKSFCVGTEPITEAENAPYCVWFARNAEEKYSGPWARVCQLFMGVGVLGKRDYLTEAPIYPYLPLVFNLSRVNPGLRVGGELAVRGFSSFAASRTLCQHTFITAQPSSIKFSWGNKYSVWFPVLFDIPFLVDGILTNLATLWRSEIMVSCDSYFLGMMVTIDRNCCFQMVVSCPVLTIQLTIIPSNYRDYVMIGEWISARPHDMHVRVFAPPQACQLAVGIWRSIEFICENWPMLREVAYIVNLQ